MELSCFIVPLERLVDLERTVEVFLIPPAGHVERGHRTRSRYCMTASRCQKASKFGCAAKFTQVGYLPLGKPLGDVGKRPSEIPAVVSYWSNAKGENCFRALHHRDVLEAVAQPEGAVMVEVVAQKHGSR
jgi:hypothetical protein